MKTICCIAIAMLYSSVYAQKSQPLQLELKPLIIYAQDSAYSSSGVLVLSVIDSNDKQ